MTVPMLLALSSLARAQSGPDQEYRDTTVTNDENRLEWTANIESQYYEFNNLDFRKLDESSDQSILDSDDRGAFGFTGATFELGYAVDSQVRFVFQGGHRGLWGNDQIGSTNAYGGFLYVPALYADLSTAPDGGVRFRIGRQFYSIGTLGGAPDYVLADVLDMVRVDVPLGSAGSLTLIPINVYGTSSDLAEVNFVGLLGQQETETFNFRGDTLTRRYGSTLTLDQIPGPVDAAVYAFYSDVGAQGTGSDISYDGALGNLSDNDWIANFGIRADAELSVFHPYVHFDASRGVDRKELVAQDVDCNGFAYGAGVTVDERARTKGHALGFWGTASFFDAYGPGFAKNGLQYSHGYVGLKGQQVGGTLLNRFMGWHPTAYLGRYGVDDRPNDIERTAGTRVTHVDAGIALPAGFSAWAGWWMMSDGGVSFVDFKTLDKLTLPYGYSTAQVAAQRRFGTSLAQEIDGEVSWHFGEHVDVFGDVAYVAPGSFYTLPIDRIAGTSLGSKTPVPAWALYTGARVDF